MFTRKNAEEISKLNEVEINDYHTALEKHREEKEAELNKSISEKANASDVGGCNGCGAGASSLHKRRIKKVMVFQSESGTEFPRAVGKHSGNDKSGWSAIGHNHDSYW